MEVAIWWLRASVVGTLELQAGRNVVFAYFHSADDGGYLGQVYPGGHFHGVGFDELHTLGTGRHQVALDERAKSEQGQEPEYESESQRRFERFKWYLFMYGVGVCVALEVLGAAREIILLEAVEQRMDVGG